MLSAVVLTHNDEKTIDRCLKSLKFVDDIIVIDDESSDKTVSIVKRYPVVLLTHKLQNDFAAQRNRAIQQAQEKWILFIDSDEQVTKELQKEIIDILKQPNYDSYYIKRRDIWLGKEVKHGEVSKAYTKGFIRLIKKGSGTWKGNVHEEFYTTGPVGKLNSYLNHYPHPTLSEFISEVNNYSSIRSRELQKTHHKAHIWEVISYPVIKFVYTFFIKGGYKDGSAGFIYSFMMSFHSFLVRAKLYQYQHIDR